MKGSILDPGLYPGQKMRSDSCRALRCAGLLSLLSLAPCLPGLPATLLVWPDSPNPIAPYADWATAAHTIQAGVDAAHPGDTVLVTNGVYATGGRAVYGMMTNRVAVDRPISLQSVNGPEVTVIQGYQLPGTTNGDGAIRCVYLTNGAVVSGFTLTRGATRLLGDTTREQSGGGIWAESTNTLVTNCTLVGNSAQYGGGVYLSRLNNCTLAGNSAQFGGGGAYVAILNACTLLGNSAQYGGGADGGSLNNCMLSDNSASGLGGGCDGSLVSNSALIGNFAGSGGGADFGTLSNCTLTGNSARYEGGGAYYGTLNNCIAYYNTADKGSNYSHTTINYCCTIPLPGSGPGNIVFEPQLASAFHLASTSPCRAAGNTNYALGVDIDGEAWLSPPSIGCDEFRAGAITGAVTVVIGATWTNVAVGFPLSLTAHINGHASASAWDFGDGITVSNQPYASHAWSAPGDYTVVLWGYNESHPEGVSTGLTIRVLSQPVYYVSAACTNPLAPYSSWGTAAQSIQAAVELAIPGGIVLATNGVYATGGRAIYGTMTNRVAVDRPVMLQSVNGPEVTVIQGYQLPGTTNGDGAIRCVYLTNGAVLSGFTLTNGATRSSGDSNREMSGGGVWSESAHALVTNCTITRSSAASWGGGSFSGSLYNCWVVENSAGSGGGVAGGSLNNCIVNRNSAIQNGGGCNGSQVINSALFANSAQNGGGSSGCGLTNCTLTGNSASYTGGGAYGSILANCILYYNTAFSSSNYEEISGLLNYCCATPLPAKGAGNIAAEPQLASPCRLSIGSPCRGAGSAAYTTGLDLDGEPWLSPPSIGCDEYWAGAVTGDLAPAIGASWTNVAIGFVVDFSAQINGRVASSRWDFGDGTGATNQPYVSHSWAAPGNYTVVFWAYNESHPEGVSGILTIRVAEQAIYYVSADSVNPAPPFSSWATAARSIQEAVDLTVPGALVLVTNGVYADGGRAVYGMMTNRVILDRPIKVQSVNGPGVTVIQGYQVPGITNGDGAIRCAYLTNGAVLSGFTLTNGATRASGDFSREQHGGGVWSDGPAGLITNCAMLGNSAYSAGGGASDGTLNNCVFRGNSAHYGGGSYASTLNNCTLTGNSASQSGGGIASGFFTATLNNCILIGNLAQTGGGAYYATLNNCTVKSNYASLRGGGAFDGTLSNCTLTANSSQFGGGMNSGTLNQCILTGNSAQYGGAACSDAFGITLNNCILTGNSAQYGGGAASGNFSGPTLNNCTLTRNSASQNGGGVYQGILNNCALTGNSAQQGGGVYRSSAYNCTLTANSASWYGGGAVEGNLNNCINYFNTAPSYPNYLLGNYINYCCTTPLPAAGVGNISAEPQLASDSHISSSSPCRGAGSLTYATGVDIDGEAWLSPPSIGCDEYRVGAVTGAVIVVILPAGTNVAVGVALDLTAQVSGRLTATVWDFGDGTYATNRVYVNHAWGAPGDYQLVLRAFNESNPQGVSTALTIRVIGQPVHYVSSQSTHPVPPYTSWETAAATLQEAADAAAIGAVVLVTNGVYASGGRAVNGLMTNRLAVTKPLIVQSVNGPEVTVIQGYRIPGTTNGDGAIRCVYLTNGAVLNGFTLTMGATRAAGDILQEQSGGGVWCLSSNALIIRCMLVGNSATVDGGGAYLGTLNNCLFTANSAKNGGGAYSSTMINCTLTANLAQLGGGGGAYTALLTNCIIYYNLPSEAVNCTTVNSCIPFIGSGFGNITREPLFVDRQNGNLRLQSNSPCINLGFNAYAAGVTDLDGRPRIVSNRVDIGAYEYQGPGFSSFIPWLAEYRLPTDGSADYKDTDADGLNNWQEWLCGTDPTSPSSVLRLQTPQSTPSGKVIFWSSVTNRSYLLERSTNLAAHPPFQRLAAGIPSQAGTTVYTDTNAPSSGPCFYRVSVQP